MEENCRDGGAAFEVDDLHKVEGVLEAVPRLTSKKGARRLLRKVHNGSKDSHAVNEFGIRFSSQATVPAV